MLRVHELQPLLRLRRNGIAVGYLVTQREDLWVCTDGATYLEVVSRVLACSHPDVLFLEGADSIDGPWDNTVNLFNATSVAGEALQYLFSADRPRNDPLRMRRFYRWSWLVPIVADVEAPSDTCFRLTALLYS